MAKQQKQNSNSELPKDIEAFFKDNPKAPSVINVEGSLFLSVHVGAAKDYAMRNGLKIEEVKNPSLEKPTSEDIKED